MYNDYLRQKNPYARPLGINNGRDDWKNDPVPSLDPRTGVTIGGPDRGIGVDPRVGGREMNPPEPKVFDPLTPAPRAVSPENQQFTDIINRLLNGSNVSRAALNNTGALDNLQASMSARGLSNSGIAGAAYGAQSANAMANYDDDQFKRQQFAAQLQSAMLQQQRQIEAGTPSTGANIGSFITSLLPLVLALI